MKGVAVRDMGEAAGVAVSLVESHADTKVEGTVITTSPDHEIKMNGGPDLRIIPSSAYVGPPPIVIPEAQIRRNRDMVNSFVSTPSLPNYSLQTVSFVDSAIAGVADKITRTAGSWTFDGFVPGQLISVTGTVSNDGVYQIDSISVDQRELILRVGESLVTESNVSSAAIAGLDTIVRDAGDFNADQFAAGQQIQLTGTRFNNGSYRIQAISQDGSALAVGANPTKVRTFGGTGRRRATQPVPLPPKPTLKTEITTDMVFRDNGTERDTITRTNGTWLDEKYAVDRVLIIEHTQQNNGIYRITEISPDGKTLTLNSLDRLTNETVSAQPAMRTDQLLITSWAIHETNDTLVKSKAKDKALGGMAKKATKASKTVSSSLKSSSDASQVGAAVALVYAESINEAHAFVGSQARIVSSGDLSVTAYAEDNFKVVAAGGAKVKDSKFGQLAAGIAISDYENRAEAWIADQAIVHAADDLIVDSLAKIPNQIDVDDQFRDVFAFSLQLPQIETTTPVTAMETGFSSALSLTTQVARLMPAVVGVAKTAIKPGASLGTSYTEASAAGNSCDPKRGAKARITKKPAETSEACTEGKKDPQTKINIAGSINVLSVDNVSHAYIGQNARVNVPVVSPEPPLPATFVADTTQRVTVNADTFSEMINISGTSKLPLPFKGTNGNKVGIGGTYNGITHHSEAKAYIADGADVRAKDDVSVTANAYALQVSVTTAGGAASKVGISGAASYHDITNTTLAYIEDTANIQAGNDVLVDASYDQLSVIVGGATQKQKIKETNPYQNQRGGTASVGVALAINDIQSNTQAFIADLPVSLGGTTADDNATDGRVQAGGDIVVDATTNHDLYVVGIAAAISGGQGKAADCDPLDGVSLSILFGDQPADKASNISGIGIAGEVAINFVDETTYAFIADGMTVEPAGKLTVNAADESMFVAAAGAFAFAKGGKNALAIAGAFTLNDVERDTRAFTDGVTISATDIAITASTVDDMITIAAGGSIAPSGAASLAGSINLNLVDSNTEAALGTATIARLTGTLDVDAYDDFDLISVAGAISLTGTAAIGAAGDVAVANNTVHAYIGDNAVVTAPLNSSDRPDNVTVTALDEVDVISVGASLAVGTTGLGLAGSVASQSVTSDVQAFIGQNATVHSDQSVLVDAHDSVDFVVVAGGIGIGLGKNNNKTNPNNCDSQPTNIPGGGFGGAAANTNIDRTVKAFIDASATVTAYGNGATLTEDANPDLDQPLMTGTGILISATAVDDIKLIGAGGAYGNKVGIAGSAAANTIDSVVLAYIGPAQRSTLTSAAPVPLSRSRSTRTSRPT